MSNLVYSGLCPRPQRVILAGYLAITAQAASAGGLYIGEFGQPNMGASRAGAQALVEDASTAWQNPAGITFLDQKKSMATAIIVDSETEFEQELPVSALPPSVADAAGNRPAGDGGDAGSTAVGGGFFHANPVNDKWGWGVSMASLSAAVLDYENSRDFAGRYHATEVNLLTITALPTLSYRVNDSLSVGLGVPLMYAELELDVAIPGPAAGAPDGKAEVEDGDDFVAGVSASALWQVTEDLRLGILYQTEMELDFDSNIDLTLPTGVGQEDVKSNVEFSFPQTIRVSATQALNESVTLLASVAWEDWSEFDELFVSTPIADNALPREWDDTWHFALGLRWRRNPSWTHYAGVAYDTDPTNARDRTADMPIDEQWRYSAGTTFHRSNGHNINASLTYVDLGDAEIQNGGTRPGGAPWSLTGDYSSNRLIFLAFSYGW
jgi:long-chain fatty acid transport protein